MNGRDKAKAAPMHTPAPDAETPLKVDIVPAKLEPNCGTAEQIAELHATLFSKAWPEATIGDLLAQRGALAHIARVAGNPPAPSCTAGFIIGRLAADELEILTFGVAKAFQNLGFGQRLLTAFCDSARQKGAARIFIEVAVDNRPAIRLYRKGGFIEVGRRSGYYTACDSPPRDALIMEFAF